MHFKSSPMTNIFKSRSSSNAKLSSSETQEYFWVISYTKNKNEMSETGMKIGESRAKVECKPLQKYFFICSNSSHVA